MPARRAAAVIVLCFAFLAIALPAGAHTGLVDSVPADGATVTRIVRVVTLTFSTPVDLAGDGAQVLDASGAPVDAEVKVDGAVVTIRPTTPLSNGRHGVRWAIRSGDAHPVRGSVQFTVDAPKVDDDAGTAGAAVRRSGPGTRTGDDADQSAAGHADGSAAADAADARHASQADAPDAGQPDAPGAIAAAAPAGARDPGQSPGSRIDARLAAALNSDPTRPLRVLDGTLRAVFYAVALGAVGVVTFLLGAWEGPRREVRLLCRLATRLSIATIVVVGIQVAVRSALTGGGWDAMVSALPLTLTPAYAGGIGLRLVGAALVAAGVPAVRRQLLTTHPIAGAAVDVRPPVGHGVSAATTIADRRVRAGWIAIAGVASIALSFALVGHAATAQPRAVSAAAAVAHALAVAVWGGGLLALVTVLTYRRRRRTSPPAGYVAARFSVLATAGVMLAAVAGVTLATVRLESLASLWTTAYGLALVAKVSVVALVAGIGAYNHFRVVPVLRVVPDHVIVRRLRHLGMIEVGLLLIVTALTTGLVALAG